MKIFLIFSRKLAKESYVPPIGIMSLAAVLRQKGYTDIKLFDLAFHSRDLIVRECMNGEPDVIGLSTDSISFENGSRLLGEIKEQCKNGTYIIGGVHPTITPEQALLKTEADVAVIGEGEITIVDVVRAIENKQGFSDIKGIAFMDHGQYIRNEAQKFIEDLDSIPFPARDLLPMDKYLNTGPDIPMLYPTMTIFASRGCKANCIYCQPVARNLFGRKMRQKSVSSVVSEINSLKNNFSFNSLYFTDDELLYNGRDWIEELCTAFIEKKLDLKWVCQARVDQIDNNLVKLMKRSGCYAIGFGVESGSQRILRYMRKGYNVSQVERAFEICRQNRIITTCNLMVGTPGETYETIQESIDMLSRIRPNLVRCSITTPTPGSDLYTHMTKENRINVTRLSDFDRWAAYPVQLDNFSKEDVQESVKKLIMTFYKNFFGILYNPLRFVKEFYFINILLKRYFVLTRHPARLWKDISFYLHYIRHRKGCEANK